MPRKKITETEELEQVMNPEQTGLTEENADTVPGLDESSSLGDSTGNIPEEPAADGAQESGPPPAAETEIAGIELPPADITGPQSEALPPDAEPLPMEQETEPSPAPVPVKSGRQAFFDLNFNELDRGLTEEERQEWNSIYASYRGRSALTGEIIGIDPMSITVRNKRTGTAERQTMYCATVVLHRARIVIPASEMWESGQERPGFVFLNMSGAVIDFIVNEVDREGGYAVASRRMAARSQRYYFSHRPALHREGARITCRVLSVGPRRCLVECYGHDISLTQRDLRYTAIPDLRKAYHPGKELDCIVKSYDAGNAALRISVKETESNPFDGAELRHPVGSRRRATIAGKYGGGVFCNLPDGTVCMCSYSYQHTDADFMVGDTVILVVQRYNKEKRQMYGKILSKW